MSAPGFYAGAPEADPQHINFWVETGPDRIYLKARHSRDRTSQNLATIERREDGVWEISSRNLFSYHLCNALGISQTRALPIATEPEYQHPLSDETLEGRA